MKADKQQDKLTWTWWASLLWPDRLVLCWQIVQNNFKFYSIRSFFSPFKMHFFSYFIYLKIIIELYKKKVLLLFILFCVYSSIFVLLFLFIYLNPSSFFCLTSIKQCLSHTHTPKCKWTTLMALLIRSWTFLCCILSTNWKLFHLRGVLNPKIKSLMK